MQQFLRRRGEPLLAALTITVILMGLAVLILAIGRRLEASPAPTPRPTTSATAAPVAILLPDELDKALEGVMTLVNDHTFGTAFLVDAQGDFLTASSLVAGSTSLRLVDNTGGMHKVRVLAVDEQLGVAMVRAGGDGRPITIGDSATVRSNDPVVLLASPKLANLTASMSGTVGPMTERRLTVRVNDLPGNLGGPILGPGARVLGVLVAPATAVPINLLAPQLAGWRASSGTELPLAPFPPALVLRGSDTTSSPTAGATLSAISPTRASASQDTVVSIQGSGFIAGKSLAVHFIPVAGGSGFNGVAPALVSASNVTLKVPAGRTVQDYVIELINGDGSIVSSRIAFTVTP